MLRIGILGTGFGREHLNIFQTVPGVAVTRMYGRDPAKLAAIAGPRGVATATDIGALIADSAVDLVDICLPTALHAAAVRQALEGGKAVFCETPLCATQAEAAELAALAAESGGRVLVSSFLKYFPEYQYLHDTIRDRSLGGLKGISFRRQTAPVWGDLGRGRIVLNLMIHEIDFAVWTLGLPQSVDAEASDAGPEQALVNAQLAYPDCQVSLQAASLMPAGFPLTIAYEAFFERGCLEFSGRFTEGGIAKNLRRYRDGAVETVEPPQDYPYRLMMCDLADSVARGLPCRMDLEHALGAIGVALQLNGRLGV